MGVHRLSRCCILSESHLPSADRDIYDYSDDTDSYLCYQINPGERKEGVQKCRKDRSQSPQNPAIQSPISRKFHWKNINSSGEYESKTGSRKINLNFLTERNMKLIRGISGIRGIVGETLTESQVYKHALAFSEHQPEGVILLARDSRPHGRYLLHAARSTLLKAGRQVVDFDIITTPTAQFLVQRRGLAGGIIITASHNPIQWNGMKFVDSDGCFLDGPSNHRLFDTADRFTGKTEMDNVPDAIEPAGVEEHIRHTAGLSAIDAHRIRSRRFKVVVDAVNGAGSVGLPAMARELGCDVIPIHCTPDGNFPRGTEPLPHNLADLGKAVREAGAHVGFATDPDGDRLAVVDEHGNPLGEEYTLTIVADGFLRSSDNRKTPMVTNLSTTMALDKVAERYGVTVERTPVGEINVVNRMKSLNALLGGEGNGGVILAESHLGRDSLVGLALFLNRMSMTTESVSEIFADMPQFVMTKDRMDLEGIDADAILQKVSRHFPDIQQDHQDGLKLIWPDRWVHIRKSNTEPIVRIYAEAETTEKVKTLVESVKQVM